MRCNLYNWNGIKIKIGGSRKDFISAAGKYIHALPEASGGNGCDIMVSVYDAGEDIMPPVDPSAGLKKSTNFKLERKSVLEIYSHGDQFWYIYRDIGQYWMDLGSNRLVISVQRKPFSFYYYNILLLFLHPLGILLENFGYYRLHASCVDIGGRAVLISGLSGSGKSTSAFALASNGGSIVSDDITFIKNKSGIYTAHTITRLFKLYRHTVRKFYPDLLRYDAVISDEGEMYFDESHINKSRVRDSVVDSIIILEKTGKEVSSITRVHPSQVITHIFPSSIQVNYGKYTENKFDFLTGMLNDIPCYRVEFGTDMKDFYRKITHIMESSSSDE